MKKILILVAIATLLTTCRKEETIPVTKEKVQFYFEIKDEDGNMERTKIYIL